MNTGMAIWMIVFAFFAFCFFAVAAVVTVRGWRDIRHLLHRTVKKE